MVRAIFLASAVPLLGISTNKLNEPTPLPQHLPNNEQGFGAVHLAEILTANGGKLFLRDEENSVPLQTGEDHTYSFSCSGSVKAALVWTDVPGHAMTVGRALVNNLDLVAISGDSAATVQVQFGNDFSTMEGPDFIHLYSHPLRDQYNTAEMIQIDAGTGKKVVLSVQGVNIPSGAQTYSLVVHGECSTIPYPYPENTCHLTCQHGTCVERQCICNGTHYGAACDLPMTEIDWTQPTTGVILTAPIDQWMYMYFDLVNPNLGYVLDVSVFGGDPDVYVRKGALPTQTKSDKSDISTKSSFVIADKAATPGRYYVGFLPYCCQNASFAVTLEFIDCEGRTYNSPNAANIASRDECGVCHGSNLTCAGCDGVPNSGLKVDRCGVCGGNSSSCAGCDGIPRSGKVIDACGVCGGDGIECSCHAVQNADITDCEGVLLVLQTSLNPTTFSLSGWINQTASVLNLFPSQLAVKSVETSLSTLSPSVTIHLRIRGPPADPRRFESAQSRFLAEANRLPGFVSLKEVGPVTIEPTPAPTSTPSPPSPVLPNVAAEKLLVAVCVVLVVALVTLLVFYVRLHRSSNMGVPRFSQPL